jgi:hypothetical protein
MRITKYCTGCKTVYELSAFAKATRRPDGLATQCRACHKVRDARRIQHGKKRAIQAKLDYGKCACHGIAVTLDNLDQFEWDHIDPKLKRFVIGKMCVQTDKSFYEELAKCRLVCRSFHVAHTREQRSLGLIGTNQSSINSLVIQKPTHQDSLFEEVTQ